MSNYVLKYRRGEEVKYISHLDFVRFIHRVMRRVNLPMEYSQGFNPHPIMTVAMPLSVGVTSDCEYMKIGIAGDNDEKFIKETINNGMPPGFEILDVRKDVDKRYDFKKLSRAEYIVDIETDADISIDEFLKNKTLNVMKKSKSGIKEADIRPHIFSIEKLEFSDGGLKLKMILSAGNEYNLKPDTVIDAMKLYIEGFLPTFYTVHRNRMLTKENKVLL